VSPLLVIVGLLAGDQLGGVVGIFLAVPVMAAVKVVFVRLNETPPGQVAAGDMALQQQKGELARKTEEK
jgi:predicted PurR-regulated permease PerM